MTVNFSLFSSKQYKFIYFYLLYLIFKVLKPYDLLLSYKVWKLKTYNFYIFKFYQDIIAILGLDELSEDDRLVVSRARKVERFLSQPFFVAEVFTGSPGKYVTLSETIEGFKLILSGELDDLPEQAFYLVGTLEEAVWIKNFL